MVWSAVVYRRRNTGSRYLGWKVVRSTPSGTCRTAAAATRSNSAAAQPVVQTTAG
jgi:hypothetical protein